MLAPTPTRAGEKSRATVQALDRYEWSMVGVSAGVSLCLWLLSAGPDFESPMANSVTMHFVDSRHLS